MGLFNNVEYIDCFSVLASKINSLGYLRLFNLDINKEFTPNEKNELKKLFLEINDCIVKKVKKYYYFDDSDDSDDNDNSDRIIVHN